MPTTITAMLGLLALFPAAAAELGPGDAVAGRAYALKACAECHNLTSRRNAPRSQLEPPDFYAIANARTTTILGLNVFLMTPHRAMPNFILTEEDRHNVVAYIMSLRDRGEPSKEPAGF